MQWRVGLLLLNQVTSYLFCCICDNLSLCPWWKGKGSGRAKRGWWVDPPLEEGERAASKGSSSSSFKTPKAPPKSITFAVWRGKQRRRRSVPRKRHKNEQKRRWGEAGASKNVRRAVPSTVPSKSIDVRRSFRQSPSVIQEVPTCP